MILTVVASLFILTNGESYLFEFKRPYYITNYRRLRTDGPFTVALSFTVTRLGASIVSLACEDEFGLPEGVVQQVGLWYWGSRISGNVSEPVPLLLRQNMTITSASPSYNASGHRYRYVNISREYTTAGDMYVIGCTTGLPEYTEVYQYTSMVVDPAFHYISNIVEGTYLYPPPSNLWTVPTFMIANAQYSDGTPIFEYLSIRDDYKVVNGDSAMRGVSFTVSRSVNVTALAFEVSSPWIHNISAGLWKTNSNVPLASVNFTASSTVVDGYGLERIPVQVQLLPGIEYRVAALVGLTYGYYDHQELRVADKPWSIVNITSAVYTYATSLMYPEKTTTLLRWSCVTVKVVGMEVCGDGYLMSPETCDDGNIVAGDGCSASCLVEAGFLCVGQQEERSICEPGVTSPSLPRNQFPPTDINGRTPSPKEVPTTRGSEVSSVEAFPMWLLGILIPSVLLILAASGLTVWCLVQYRRKTYLGASKVEPESDQSSWNTTSSASGTVMKRAPDGGASAEEVRFTTTSGEVISMSHQVLGEGAFGVVRMGVDMNGQMVAIKAVPYGMSSDEIAVLQGFVHPNIITLRGIFHSHVNTYIVMEFATGGSLAGMINAFGIMTLPHARQFTRGILCGLSAIHQKGVIHRDIKPGNILYMADGVVKVADFGIVTNSTKTFTTDKGTLRYISPEVIKGERPTTVCDIWAVGLTLVEMLTGIKPWHHVRDDFGVIGCLHSSSVTDVYELPKSVPDEAIPFIRRMLNFDPRYRPSAEQLLDDGFFTYIPPL